MILKDCFNNPIQISEEDYELYCLTVENADKIYSSLSEETSAHQADIAYGMMREILLSIEEELGEKYNTTFLFH